MIEKKNWIYIGIFLDKKSREKLKILYPSPENWKEYYDHMTVVFNDGTDIASAIKSINETNIGKVFKFKVVSVGISDKAFSVHVELPLGVVCANKIAHVTLAVSENGNAVDSNYITNWSNICTPFEITGIMDPVYPSPLKGLLGDFENSMIISDEANIY